MQRLSGKAELAPKAKADLQQFVSMFNGGWQLGALFPWACHGTAAAKSGSLHSSA